MSRKLDPEPQREIFTLRRSIFVWLCGGVIGWAAAILLVYSVFQTGGSPQIAETEPQGPDASSTAVADSQNPDAASLSKIAPAAGTDAKAEDDKAEPKPDQPADAAPAQ